MSKPNPISTPHLLFISILLILLVSVSGCVSDIQDVIKTNPLVDQFIKEHPKAQITSLQHFTEQQSQTVIDQVRKDCDNQYIKPNEFYKAVVMDPDTKLQMIVWVDVKEKIILCVVKEGTLVCENGKQKPCGTNVGECTAGVQTCANNQWGQCVGAIQPTNELCDGKDNDCDGQTDENWPNKGKPCDNNQGVYICNNEKTGLVCSTQLTKPAPSPGAGGVTPLCGDVNNDGKVNQLDADIIINYLFSNGPAPNLKIADVNGNGVVDVEDVVYLINYIFKHGPTPKCKGLEPTGPYTSPGAGGGLPSENQPPNITGIDGPTAVQINQSGNWTINAYDPEDGVLSYQATWGDGSSSSIQSSSTFTHAYTTNGTFSINFTVYDNESLSGSKNTSVNVTTTPPPITVTIKGVNETYANQSVQFFITVQGGTPPYQVNLQCGNNLQGEVSGNYVGTCIYSTAGQYTARVYGYDSAQKDFEATKSIKINTPLPDLIVKSVTLDKSVYSEVDVPKLHIVFKNIGYASTTPPGYFKCIVKNKKSGWVMDSGYDYNCFYYNSHSWSEPILPNEEFTFDAGLNLVEVGWSPFITLSQTGAVEGLNTFELTIDYLNYVSESDETNNMYTFNIQVSSSTPNQPPNITGISGPSTLQVNQQGTWTVNANDPENGPLRYTAKWGDGSSTPIQSSKTFTHNYTTNGTYTINFTVYDNQSLSASKTHTVTVTSTAQNLPDLIVKSVTLSPQKSVYSKNDEIGIDITLKNIGTEVAPGWRSYRITNKATGQVMDFDYSLLLPGLQPGEEWTDTWVMYEVPSIGTIINLIEGNNELEVMVDHGNKVVESNENNNIYTFTIQLASSTSNQPPNITSINGPSTIQVNQQGTWTVNANDPEYKPLQYQVNWGDGSGDSPKQSSTTFTHAFSQIGTFTVTFTVYDDQDLSGSKTSTVTVSSAPPVNQPPSITSINGPSTLQINQQGTWIVNANDPEGKITKYTADWGDGSAVSTQSTSSTSATFTHTYTQTGTYTITFTVYDNESLSGSKTSTVTVSSAPPVNQPPTISDANGPTSLYPGQEGTWTVTANDPEGGDLIYKADWKDGSSVSQITSASTPVTFNHAYSRVGTFTPYFTVIDNQGASAGKSASTVTVAQLSNYPPVIISLTGPSSLGVNVQGTWNIKASDPDRSTLTFDIDWRDGSTHKQDLTYDQWSSHGTEWPIGFSHVYTQTGTFTPIFKVTDVQKQSVTQSAPTVTVASSSTNLAPVIDDLTGPSAIVEYQCPTFNIKAHDPEGSPLCYDVRVSAQHHSPDYVGYMYLCGDPVGCSKRSQFPGYRYMDNCFSPSSPSIATNMYVTGANNVFAYADSYTIIFSVKDDQGVTTTQNWPLKVQKSDLPIISDVSPTKVVLNQNTAWTVTAYDPDGEAISYQADWGDGSPVSDKQFYSVFTHTYTKVGTYTAIFTVYDEEGPDKGLKTSKSVAIVVLPPCTYDLSLVLLYGFDEGAGTKVYDLSCSTSNDGLISYIYGAPANAVTWVAQDEGRTALKFIGGGWVKTPDANTLDVSSGFTIDAWVKINQFKHLYSTIVKKDGAYGLRFAGSPTVKLHGWFISSSDGSLVEIYSHKTDWITDRWYRLTFTYDGTTMKLYIDGALDGSQPYSGSAVNSNGEIRLGWGTSAEWLVGLINELRIYSRALSGSEIGAPSNSPPGIEGVSGPSSIGIYHQGTWTVDAYDPEYKPLQYQVNWGDGSGDSPKQSSPTFAHIYPTTGTYTIAFTVYDDQGLTASKTTTVNAITLAGPVLWYKFDEGSGTTAQDSSGNGFHGSIKGSVKYVDGKIGKALSYNGTSGSYVTRSDSNALHSAGLTVMAWIKPATDPNSWSGFHVILTKADQYLFRFSGDDLYGNTYRDLYGGVASGGSVFIQGESFDWQPNEWYHVAFTYEGTVLKLYVNGVEKASQEYHLPIYYSNIPVFVGSNFAGYDGIFNGVIDDVRIYNRALPQGEIQFLIS